MDRVLGVADLEPSLGRLFVVVGVFDGLHVGHAYLLRHLVAEARARSARPTVVTFDAHPDAVLTGSAPPLLLDPEQRAALLQGAGVECLVVVHFDDALRHTPYDAFVRSIADRVYLAGFLMTPDAAFGHERRGTPETLAELGRTTEPSFDVVTVEPFELDGEQVRSSAIREQIAAGDIQGAARLLGRPYTVIADLDDHGAVTFAMPVALPPTGSHPVVVASDDGERRAGRLTVGSTSRVLLEPPWPSVGAARITFS